MLNLIIASTCLHKGWGWGWWWWWWWGWSWSWSWSWITYTSTYWKSTDVAFQKYATLPQFRCGATSGLHRTSSIHEGFNGKFIYKLCIYIYVIYKRVNFHCNVWLPEGTMSRIPRSLDLPIFVGFNLVKYCWHIHIYIYICIYPIFLTQLTWSWIVLHRLAIWICGQGILGTKTS